MLAEMARTGERDSGGRGPIVGSQRATQLSDLGVTKQQSSDWQNARRSQKRRAAEGDG